ncbi:hypothetical protein [Methanosarcina mazei]|nr:hypothetical protein [Methanosarcina mazei]
MLKLRYAQLLLALFLFRVFPGSVNLSPFISENREITCNTGFSG